MIPLILLVNFLLLLPALYLLAPRLLQLAGRVVGWHVRRLTQPRRDALIERVKAEKKEFENKTGQSSSDEEWEQVDKGKSYSDSGEAPRAADKSWTGIIGFFHPFCNAGGGGERLLWAAVRTTQRRYPNAICVVYTGDHNVSKVQMLKRVEERFNICLHPPTVMFMYLSARRFVLASSWPNFTLLGQSIGSLILAYDAFSLVVPDVLIDTMGYAFALALSKLLFPSVPTGAYVHYPTISTDMLGSLDADPSDGKGVNAGAGRGWRGVAKRAYWHLFALLYSYAGGSIDVVMTNSSWTQNHITQLWDSPRKASGHKHPIELVYPPCAVEELEREIDLTQASEKQRTQRLLYIAQFRPEKNHQLVLRAFARMLEQQNPAKTDTYTEKDPRLLLIGSVRDSADETYIYSLRLLAHELHITSAVTFLLNASWPAILAHLRTASVGINAMWNEHFGIGVVEYQAAGLISVVNASGGPKNDICIDEGDGPTGFHATTDADYADAFRKALSLKEDEAIAMRIRSRHSSRRFNEAAFDTRWVVQIDRLVELWKR